MKPFILSASCVVLLAHAAAAQTATGWTGKGTDINWSTAANWSAGAPPGVDTNTRSLLFGLDYETAGGTGSTTANNDLTAYEGHQILFEAASSNPEFTLTGNGFTLSNIGAAFPRIENRSSVLQAFNLSGALTLNGGATGKAEINPLNGDLLFSNTTPITLTAGTQLQVVGGTGRMVTFNGALSGAGALALNSNSTVVSSGTNTYSGGTTVNGGVLRGTQSTGTPFGTGSIVANSGTLSVAPDGTGADVSLSGASDSGATFTYRGGTLALDKGANNSLTFTVGNPGAAANSVLVRGARGTLVLAPAGGTGAANLGAATGERFLVNGGVAQVSVNGGADTMVSPTVFGQNNDTNKSGEFLAYDATNGFVPATYGNTNFSSATTNTTVANVTAAQTVTASRAVFALKTSAAISLNTNQSLTIGNGSGQAGLILNGGTIQPGASQTGTSLAFGAAEGVIYTSNANGTISTVVSGTGGVTKTGPGILTLSGANTFSGGLVLNGGSTRLTVANTISGGITINAGATLEANTAAADNTSFNNLFGAGGNSFTFNGGTFLGNSGADRTITGRTFTIGAEGATFNIVGNYPNFTEVSFTQVRLSNSASSLLNGSGTVTKNGGGRLQFQNASGAFSGAIVVNDGTLEAGGSSLGNASATNTITINGGNLATSSTVPQAITMNGGAMSTNGGSLAVSGTMNVTAPSYIFLNEFWRDSDSTNPNAILARSATINGKLSGTANLGVAVNRTNWSSNNGSVILRNTANDFSGTFTVGRNLRLESNATAGTGNTLGTAAVILAGGGLNLRDNGAAGGTTIAYGNDVSVIAPFDIYNRGTMAAGAFIDVNRSSGTNANNTFRLGSLTLGAQPLTITGANGYGVEFGAASKLTANATLNVDSAPLTFSGGLGEDATGGRGLTKNGTAALTFASNAAYTGATTVNAGTLVIGGAAGRITGTSGISLANDAGLTIDNSGGNLSDRVSDAIPISMSGASLTLTSPTGSATNANETVGVVTLVDGVNTITATQGNSGAISALTLGSLVRQNQATVRFVGTNLGLAGNGSRIIIADQTTDIPFIPWATIDNDFAQYIAASDSGFVRGVSAVAYVTDPAGDSGLAASQNVKLIANNLTLTADRAINSLNFANTADGRTLDVGNKTLTLANGGLLVVSNSAAINGTTGGITSGMGDLVVTNNAALNIGAVVKDGTGAVSLTKAGPGTLTLSGLNTFTGDVAINEGILSISDVANIGEASNLGAGTALKLADTLAPVTLRFTGATDSTDRALSVFSGGAIVDVSTAATNLTWSGSINSAGSFTKLGAGTLTFSGATSIDGGFTSTAGTVGFTGPSTIIKGDFNIGSNGTTAQVTTAGNGTLSVGSGSASNINIGSEFVAASTNSSGTVDLSGLSSFTANVNQIRIGSDVANGSPAGGVNTGSLILAKNNNITATSGILVGDSLQDGGSGVRNITFGSGTNTVVTPVLTIGGRKYNATGSIAPGGTLNLSNTGGATARATLNVGANTGVGTGTEPVASFDLSNGTIIGSLFSINVADRTGAGNNPGAGDATGSLTIGSNNANSLNIAPTAGIAVQLGHLDFQSPPAANVTPGSGTEGARSIGTMTINGGTHVVTGAQNSSAVALGNFSGTFANATPTITHSASGTLVINGGSFTVNSNGTTSAFNLGAISGSITGANNTSTGTLTINGGTVTVNNQIQGNRTVAQSTSTLNLTGGTLNMAGKNITGLNNLNFSGGTLRNLGTLDRGLDQTGDASLLDVASNNATISGAYNVTDGDVTVAASRTLTVGGGMTAGGLSGTSNILINGTLSGSLTVNAGAVVKGGGTTAALTLAGGIIAPGNSPGILNTGNLTLSGGTLALELNGTTAGTGYDQISTAGTVSLTANTNFTLSLGIVPAIGSTFTLISNDGTDLVSFSNGALLSFNGGPGIADDTTFTTSQGYEFRLDYNGGTGNDIVLVTTVPEPGSAMLLLAGVGSLLGLRRFRRSAV